MGKRNDFEHLLECPGLETLREKNEQKLIGMVRETALQALMPSCVLRRIHLFQLTPIF